MFQPAMHGLFIQQVEQMNLQKTDLKHRDYYYLHSKNNALTPFSAVLDDSKFLK